MCIRDRNGGVSIDFRGEPANDLRPNDTLTIELEVDPSFRPETYTLDWTSAKGISATHAGGHKISLPITNRQVGEQFDVQCRLVTTNAWHRMQGCDDLLVVFYKVLPPIGG